MTEEQLAVIRRILEDYDKFAATASERYPLRGCYFEWEKLPLSERGAFPKPFSSRNRTLGSFARCDGRPEALPLDSANF